MSDALLLNNESVSMLSGNSILKFQFVKVDVLSFHPRFSKQSPQDNDTSNDKMLPFRFMNMGDITFLDLRYHLYPLLFASRILLGSIFYLQFKRLHC